ncbi:MAG: hypothetical protein KDA61_10440, partial [Planctomycetales bacterium]|nr:hypothetical protein [Planctomycetales bacterium]
MKPQLKNVNAPVRFLLNHGEKIVIAVILAATGLLINASLGRQGLDSDKQPDNLRDKVTQARARVTGLTVADAPEDQLPLAANENVQRYDPSSDQFPRLPSWDPPAVAAQAFRTDPTLLPVMDLEVNARSGMLSSADPQMIERKKREMLAERERMQREMEENRDRQEDEGFGRGEGGGFGRGEGGFGMGEGGMGRGFGAMGGGQTTKSGAIVVPTGGGAFTQGYEQITPRSWVTVLGSVPIKQQNQLYEDALAEARGYMPDRDMPEYIGYEIQRTLATGEPKWATIKAMTGARLIETGKSKLVYAVVRPPGHHAERRVFGGFCYFNNAA